MERNKKTREENETLKTVRAVFFDAGNTLFRPFPSVGHVYARTAAKYRCRVSPAWVEDRFHTVWRRRNGLAHLKSEHQEKEWWRGLVKEVFGSRISTQRFKPFFNELYEIFAQPKSWRLYPDTMPTLRALKKRGGPLGVVSNWDSRLFRLCDRLGVSDYMDFVLASAVEGAAKPEKTLFRRALTLANVDPSNALHVGDSYREDYWGARQAGLKALLLCRNGLHQKGALCITTLKEVRRLIR
ncbi:MAG: HAD-IA family hydrolase [Elusimicrobia bacterium]|nr:HAD-IA family hydrolase [Elusimicrobiota bacterium]